MSQWISKYWFSLNDCWHFDISGGPKRGTRVEHLTYSRRERVHICNPVRNYFVLACKIDEISSTVSHIALTDDFKQTMSNIYIIYLTACLHFRIWHFKRVWKVGGKTWKKQSNPWCWLEEQAEKLFISALKSDKRRLSKVYKILWLEFGVENSTVTGTFIDYGDSFEKPWVFLWLSLELWFLCQWKCMYIHLMVHSETSSSTVLRD